MSADWVPFHRRLARGSKRSVPRGLRFVFLELSLEARLHRGVIHFPTEWSTLKSVHDLIGGKRSEIRRALDVFSRPDGDGVAPIEVQRTEYRHDLVITKWGKWIGREPILPDQRRRILDRDGLLCGICGKPVQSDDVHIDHRRPVILGGDTRDDNLRVTHSKCNLRRPKRPAEYAQ